MASLLLRACLNAAYTLDAVFIAVDNWLTHTANGSASGSAGSANGDLHVVSEVVATALECAGIWLRIGALGFVLVALAAKVWCRRGFVSQASLMITAYRILSDVAAFSFLQYMPTAEHLRILSASINQMRRAVNKTRTVQQDFQTDCDSRLLTGCCIRSACLVLTFGALLFSTVLAAMHVVAPAVVLIKIRSAGLGVAATNIADWSLREWLLVVGLVNQIFSIADPDEERKRSMLRLLLTPHESAGADAIALQSAKLEAFEVSLVESLTKEWCDFAGASAFIRRRGPDCIVKNNCTIGEPKEAASPAEELPPDVLTDDAVLSEEISSMSCSVAVCAIMTMRSADMETILRRVANKKSN
jgi:hypothetical protein